MRSSSHASIHSADQEQFMTEFDARMYRNDQDNKALFMTK